MEEEYILIYTVRVKDEFGRHFEAYGRIDANYLIIKQQADPFYLQMMEQLVAHVLWRMGTEVSAEWLVEVTEEADRELNLVN